jgi:nicotinate-nucleotide--dimethylbenzimidazole phosphoribosyltransferase
MFDLAGLLADAPGPDRGAASVVAERAAQILRPAGAFARLDEVAAWLAAWQRSSSPSVKSPAAIVFVADHGVTVEGVSAYPRSVTQEMLRALRDGAATASVLARDLGLHLEAVDVGVGEPTGNLATEPALSTERFESCFHLGRDRVAASECDILVLGEMGIGNTTAASAICAGLFGLTAEDWTGRGTGVDEATLGRKVEIVRAVQSRLKDASPLEVLRQAGGAELAAIAGAAVEARRRSIPIVLDGFVVTAALAALEVAVPGALDHCLAGHCSSEPGHRLLLEKLGKRPLLDLDLRLGEGSGALLALPLVRAAAACVTDVATFEEWGLTGPR